MDMGRTQGTTQVHQTHMQNGASARARSGGAWRLGRTVAFHDGGEALVATLVRVRAKGEYRALLHLHLPIEAATHDVDLHGDAGV